MTRELDRAPGFQTRAIHHGYGSQDPYGAVSPPIYMTSTFAFDTNAEAEAIFAGESDLYVYGRQHNPTQDLLERRLANLEGAQAAVATASGMAAINAVFLSLLGSGDEIVVHHTIYATATTLIDEGLPAWASR